MTASETIEEVLRRAGEPLSVEEICQRVWGRCGSRERNVAYVNLHRLDERGLIEKSPMKFKLRTTSGEREKQEVAPRRRQ